MSKKYHSGAYRLFDFIARIKLAADFLPSYPARSAISSVMPRSLLETERDDFGKDGKSQNGGNGRDSTVAFAARGRGLAKAAKRDIRFMGRKEKAVAASLVSGPGPGPNPRESVVSTAKAGFESTTNSCKAYYDNLVPVRVSLSLVINDHRLCASRCSLSRLAT